MSNSRNQRLDAALAAKKAYLSGAQHPTQIMDNLVYEFLSPMERRIYDLIESGAITTSGDVVKYLDVSLVNAGVELKYLYDKGILTREERRDETGKWYVYGVALKSKDGAK